MRKSSCLLITFLVIETGFSQTSKYTDENRPYKFGFNIEGYQHRQEEKDEKGLIKGEYGFITADGYYRVTVYATDENGDFRIISMKNYYVGFPPEDPQTTPQPATQYGPGFQSSGHGGSAPAANPLSVPAGGRAEGGKKELDPVQLTGLTACSDCLIPTTKKPGVGTRFGGGGGGRNGNTVFGGRGGQSVSGGSGGGTPAFGSRIRGGNAGVGNQGGFDGTQRGPNSGGSQGGLGAPPTRGNGRFSGSAGGNGGTSSGGRRPEIGTVRDGLPRGVSVDDIKALLYTFNYTVGFHGHHEDGYRNGDKQGDYFFDGRDGTERKVEYIANEFGYQPNITFIDLPENDLRRPKEETEKEYGLKGYEFKWFYKK